MEVSLQRILDVLLQDGDKPVGTPADGLDIVVAREVREITLDLHLTFLVKLQPLEQLRFRGLLEHRINEVLTRELRDLRYLRNGVLVAILHGDGDLLGKLTLCQFVSTRHK